jgi:hypothetical protein
MESDPKKNPVLARLNEIINDQVFPALSEGGLGITWDEFAAPMSYGVFGTDRNKVTLLDDTGEHGYQLLIEVVPPLGQDPDDPKVAQVNIEILLAGMEERRTGILLSRRTDGGWKACAAGTLGLPTGHPLGDLAHAERHLGLKPGVMVADLDDRRGFRAIVEAVHLHRFGAI